MKSLQISNKYQFHLWKDANIFMAFKIQLTMHSSTPNKPHQAALSIFSHLQIRLASGTLFHVMKNYWALLHYFHLNGYQPAVPATWDRSILQFKLNPEVPLSSQLELDAGHLYLPSWSKSDNSVTQNFILAMLIHAHEAKNRRCFLTQASDLPHAFASSDAWVGLVRCIKQFFQ